MIEQSTTSGTSFYNRTNHCKRCGKQGFLLSNGYCPRCDDVLFGRKV